MLKRARKLIEQYKDGYRVVAEALAGATDEELDAPPAPGKWTAREIVHHLADSEMTSAIRLRLLVATDNPPIAGYDQEEFARRLHYDRPIEASLEAFKAARRTTAEILDRMTRGRVGARGHAHGARPVHRRALARDLLDARAQTRRTDPGRPRRGEKRNDGTRLPSCHARRSSSAFVARRAGSAPPIDQEFLAQSGELGNRHLPCAGDLARRRARFDAAPAAPTSRPGCRSAASRARTRTAGRATQTPRIARRETPRSRRRPFRPAGRSRDRARESGSRRSSSSRACGTSARTPPAGRTRRAARRRFIASANRSAFDPRRADQLERPRRASALRHVRSLEQHRARIDDARVERRDVRRGQHPRQRRLVEVHLAAPSLPSPRPRGRRRCRTCR